MLANHLTIGGLGGPENRVATHENRVDGYHLNISGISIANQ